MKGRYRGEPKNMPSKYEGWFDIDWPVMENQKVN